MIYEYFIKIFIRFIKRNFLKDSQWSRVQLEPFLQGQSFDVLFHTRVFVGIFSIDRIQPKKEASDAVTTNRRDWVYR